VRGNFGSLEAQPHAIPARWPQLWNLYSARYLLSDIRSEHAEFGIAGAALERESLPKQPWRPICTLGYSQFVTDIKETAIQSRLGSFSPALVLLISTGNLGMRENLLQFCNILAESRFLEFGI
jgi:hypothetical protein